MFKIFRIVAVVLIMCLATKAFAVESASDYFDLRAMSGLVIQGGSPTQSGVPATQMFKAGITIYVDSGAAMYWTAFTITSNRKVQQVNLISHGAYSGLNFIRGTRGIILQVKPQHPELIDPSLIDLNGYVTILNKTIYLPDDMDVPAGEARYVDTGNGIDYGLDHLWDVNAPLQIAGREFKVSYLRDDSEYFSPRIDELDGMGTGAACGDINHQWMWTDFNHDCYVNFKDLAIFAESWMHCTAPTPPCNY